MTVSFGVRASAIVLLAGIMASSLAGCGRRGQLLPPPDPSVVAAGTPESVTPIAKRPRRVPIAPPHEPFVLDPLL